MLGFNHTEGEFPDMRTLSENLRFHVVTVFVSKHYDGFFCKAKVAISCNIWHLLNKLGLFSLCSILGQI